MDIPYHWYSQNAPVPPYYPSPAPSTDPSPAPRPHQQLHDQYIHHQFDQIQSNIGPARVHGPGSPRRPRILPESADRYSDAVFLENPPNYRPGTPSSMTSPYSPYDYGARPRSRSFSYSDDFLPIPSPGPSVGSADALPSVGSTSLLRSDAGDHPRPRAKHKKHRLCDADRKEICEYHMKYKNARQEDIGTKFGVERSTISKVLKDKERWLKISPEADGTRLKSKRPSKYPEIEEVLEASLQHWTDKKIPITDQLIRQKALEIAESYNISLERFKGSSGWVENFKHRQNIKRGEWRNARRLPSPPNRLAELPPRVIPDTPVIKPYERQPKLKSNQPSQTPLTQEEALKILMRPVARQTLIDPALYKMAGLTDVDLFPPIPPTPAEDGYVITPNVMDPPQPCVGTSDRGAGISANTSVNPAHPTCKDAENAIKVVISFLDMNGSDIIKDDDRQTLHRISSELSQRSNRLSCQQTPV